MNHECPMASKLQKKPRKKYFTLVEANAMLPLLQSVLRDVTDLANDLRDRHERLLNIQGRDFLDQAHEEEIQHILRDLDRGQDRMAEFQSELEALGVELKDYFKGLIDFRAMKDGKEVYLCWMLGEPTVAHWHEIESGFGGRKRLI